MWLAIMLIAEFITCFAANKWFPIDSFAVSLTFPVILIVAMRWGWFSAIHAVVGAVATCVFSQMSGGQAISVERVVISLVGNVSLLTAIPLFTLLGKGDKKAGRKVVKEKWLFTVAYVAILYAISNIAFAATDAIFTYNNFFILLARYFVYNLITLVFALIIVVSVRRPDGLFEDQKTYLLRVEKEREEKKLKNNQINEEI